MQRWQYALLHSSAARAARNWLDGISISRWRGVTIYDIVSFFRREIFSTRFNDRASAVSFKFMLALPPTILLLFTLIPYFPISNIDKVIAEIITMVTPNVKTQENISEIITDVYKHKKNTLLSLSLILTLYYSSNGMLGLMRQFNKALPGFKKRNLIGRRSMAVALTFMLLLSVLLTASYFIFEAWAFKTIGLKNLQDSLVMKLVGYAVVITFIFITVGFIYRYGPALKNRWHVVSPGSVMATALIVITTFLLNYIANNLINYSKIYGSIGSLIIFVLWIFYNAQILLIGFELNVNILMKNDQDEVDH
jgi:membrane protein